MQPSSADDIRLEPLTSLDRRPAARQAPPPGSVQPLSDGAIRRRDPEYLPANFVDLATIARHLTGFPNVAQPGQNHHLPAIVVHNPAPRVRSPIIRFATAKESNFVKVASGSRLSLIRPRHPCRGWSMAKDDRANNRIALCQWPPGLSQGGSISRSLQLSHIRCSNSSARASRLFVEQRRQRAGIMRYTACRLRRWSGEPT